MVANITDNCVRSGFPNGTNGIPISFKVFTNGTIGNTICINGNANGTVGSPNGTIGTIGKITNGTNGRTPNGANLQWLCSGFPNGTIGNFINGTNGNARASGTIGITIGTTNGTIGRTLNDIGIPLVPLVEPWTHALWAKLPTLESRMIQYGVLNLKFINFTNKLYFYRDDSSK